MDIIICPGLKQKKEQRLPLVGDRPVDYVSAAAASSHAFSVSRPTYRNPRKDLSIRFYTTRAGESPATGSPRSFITIGMPRGKESLLLNVSMLCEAC